MKARRIIAGLTLIIAGALAASADTPFYSNDVYLAEWGPQFNVKVRAFNTTPLRFYLWQRKGDTAPFNPTNWTCTYHWSDQYNVKDVAAMNVLTGANATTYITISPSTNSWDQALESTYAALKLVRGTSNTTTWCHGQHTTLTSPEVSVTTAFSGITNVNWSGYIYSQAGYAPVIADGLTMSQTTNARGQLVLKADMATATATNVTLAALTDSMTSNYFPVGDGTNLVLLSPSAVRTVLDAVPASGGAFTGAVTFALATAIGTGTTAAGTNAFAAGEGCQAAGHAAVALGSAADALYDYSMALGSSVTAPTNRTLRMSFDNGIYLDTTNKVEIKAGAVLYADGSGLSNMAVIVTNEVLTAWPNIDTDSTDDSVVATQAALTAWANLDTDGTDELLLDGSRPMTGALQMGDKSIQDCFQVLGASGIPFAIDSSAQLALYAAEGIVIDANGTNGADTVRVESEISIDLSAPYITSRELRIVDASTNAFCTITTTNITFGTNTIVIDFSAESITATAGSITGFSYYGNGAGLTNIGAAALAADSVTASEIAAAAVGASELSNTTVTAGSYGSTTAVGTFTVDADGRLTAAANATIIGETNAYAAAWDGDSNPPSKNAVYDEMQTCVRTNESRNICFTNAVIDVDYGNLRENGTNVILWKIGQYGVGTNWVYFTWTNGNSYGWIMP